MAIPEISNIWSQYQQAMEEFKEVHRSNESAKQDGNKARELRNDIGAIETEIENGNFLSSFPRNIQVPTQISFLSGKVSGKDLKSFLGSILFR